MEYSDYEKLRDLKGMKNSDVARIGHIPPSTFSDWKQGKSKPKQEKLEKIANALGVSIDDFLGYTFMDAQTKEEFLTAAIQLESVDIMTERDRKILEYINLLNDEQKIAVEAILKTMVDK